MKVRKTGGCLLLIVETTEKEELTTEMPMEKIHYWYPFNINFYYKYSEAEEYLYLVKDPVYDGVNHYKADVLKRTNKLNKRDGVMFHPHVYRRNRYIINRAKQLGITTIDGTYTSKDIQQGYNKLRDLTSTLVEDRIEKRVLDGINIEEDAIGDTEEDWTSLVYSSMTPEEEELFLEVGEIYSMLSVMRKIVG